MEIAKLKKIFFIHCGKLYLFDWRGQPFIELHSGLLLVEFIPFYKRLLAFRIVPQNKFWVFFCFCMSVLTDVCLFK